jgi:hypothetical protein
MGSDSDWPLMTQLRVELQVVLAIAFWIPP